MQMEELEIDSEVRGDYKSADLYLVPKARMYADMLAEVFEAFDEEQVELVIDQTSMPLPYYEALEIPLDVFSEEYEVSEGERIDVDEAVELARDLLGIGLFDIGFEGGSVSVTITHNGYLNVKPVDIDSHEFRETIESIGDTDE